ncbi:periplasmic heavy metal sensor [Hyphococcus sp.]|uniref:periplasmic heavy metal sensor n=1 Tax=Hyphococcus sp. TaxID=2038636 RepID=UPI003CCBCC02
MGRGLIILLVASLGLNIFAFGHFSGRILAGDKPPPSRSHIEHGSRGGFDNPFRLMRYADELSPELREAFRAEIKKELPALREQHDRMRELRRQLSALISADTWDGAAVAAKLEEIRTAQDRQRDAFNRAYVGAFETLPADQRKLLVERAKERRDERRRKRKMRRDGDARHDQRSDGPPPDRPADSAAEENEAPPEN